MKLFSDLSARARRWVVRLAFGRDPSELRDVLHNLNAMALNQITRLVALERATKHEVEERKRLEREHGCLSELLRDLRQKKLRLHRLTLELEEELARFREEAEHREVPMEQFLQQVAAAAVCLSCGRKVWQDGWCTCTVPNAERAS